MARAAAPALYDAVGRFLQAVASGQRAPLPGGLSPQVADILEELVEEPNA